MNACVHYTLTSAFSQKAPPKICRQKMRRIKQIEKTNGLSVMNVMFGTVKFWFRNSRWVALPQSLMPSVVAVALAVQRPGFSVLLSLPAVVGVCMAHLSLNLFDDYFDYKRNKPGIRDTLARAGIRARTGKCEYLVSGEATTGQLLAAALAFGAVTGLCGIAIFVFRGWPVLWFAIAAIFLGLSYSGGPLRLSYRGMGELTIGLMFGPMLVVGVYFSACGEFGAKAALIGLTLGLLVTNILYTHSAVDLDADRSVGKKTLACMINSHSGILACSFIFTFLPCMAVLVGVLCGTLSRWFLLTLATLPLAVALAQSVRAFFNDPDGPAVRRIWYGSMPRWAEIEAAGIAWFMLRWYLARNLLMAFSFVAVAAAIVEVAQI